MSKDQNTPTDEIQEETVETTDQQTDAVESNGAADTSASAAQGEATDMSDGNTETAADAAADAGAEAERNLAGWQRTLAEFQNYKRRVEKENKELTTRVTLETITRILPIIDDFERALENVPDDIKDNPWFNGITLIESKFKRLLEDHNITPVDPVGELFDPNHHQAISKDDSDEVESDHVIQTLQKGYVSGNHLLRPALVRVAN